MKVARSCPTLCAPWTDSPWSSPGQNPAVGSSNELNVIEKQSQMGLEMAEKMQGQRVNCLLEWVVRCETSHGKYLSSETL